MPDTTPSDPDTTSSFTWLWQRQPNSTDLEKALIPAHLIPAGWLPILQHRYTDGNRVRFTYDGQPRFGTVVQDQGMHLAIAGERPGSGFTIHKANVRPHDAEPAAPADPVIDTAIDPHPHPVVRWEGRAAAAYWNLGPSVGGWVPWARLHIAFQPDAGFAATLSSIEELNHVSRNRERRRPLDQVAVHHRAARKPSHRAARECLRDAIDVVISAAGQSLPAVCVHFVPTLRFPQGK